MSESVRGRDEEYNYYIKLDDPPCKQCPECSRPKTPKAESKPIEYQPPPPQPQSVKVVNQQYAPAFSLAIKPEPKPEPKMQPVVRQFKTEVIEAQPVKTAPPPPATEEFCECCTHCREEQARQPKQKLEFYNFMKDSRQTLQP